MWTRPYGATALGAIQTSNGGREKHFVRKVADGRSRETASLGKASNPHSWADGSAMDGLRRLDSEVESYPSGQQRPVDMGEGHRAKAGE